MDSPVIRSKLMWILLFILLTCAVSGCTEELQARTAGTDGSAKWAYSAALPMAQSQIGSDVVLVEISGEDLIPDGRLAANSGKWILTFSSYNQRVQIPITIDYAGNLTVGERTRPSRIEPISSSFADTTTVFAATLSHSASGKRTVQSPVILRYDKVTGSHVWSINYKIDSKRESHKVRWDGIWLESR